ncbi:prolyl oligopeptidase family serine peptidase [Nocardioides sp. YIM 152588]|uniref:alpha/beta hydrolase family protein n=1 Tax=Nocardioides sp. YIM 152588 TaxID=3158259 RepID=UPI0032E4BED2
MRPGATRAGRGTWAAALLVVAGCSAGSSGEGPGEPGTGGSDATTATPSATAEPTLPEPTRSASKPPTLTPDPPHPVSVPALAAADLTGGGLRLGAVRERTAGYTSYDVTFRSTTRGAGSPPLTISGVLNVPAGSGPFPAVVLAHGYIDPTVYVRGQGMTRERGFLADRGYVALHVDYRNHAESTDDPRSEAAVRLGYSADVVAATRALVRSEDVAVDPDRIALFGRSMGSGVVLKALEAEPGLVAAGVVWASVSSLEAENFEHFNLSDTPEAELRARLKGIGFPDEDRAFWRGVSSRPYFDRITEPVLMAHGRVDETCPPRWATATHRALEAAGVDATLEWYDDQHAFGPAFVAAMERTVRFLRARMPA